MRSLPVRNEVEDANQQERDGPSRRSQGMNEGSALDEEIWDRLVGLIKAAHEMDTEVFRAGQPDLRQGGEASRTPGWPFVRTCCETRLARRSAPGADRRRARAYFA